MQCDIILPYSIGDNQMPQTELSAFRFRAEAKTALRELAKRENRSMSNYLETILLREAAKLKDKDPQGDFQESVREISQ
jgi:hypothetical protein